MPEICHIKGEIIVNTSHLKQANKKLTGVLCIETQSGVYIDFVRFEECLMLD